MSLDPNHLPSPAPTPSEALVLPGAPTPAPPAAPAAPDQEAIRTAVENQLLQLAQDLYEMEISAGYVRENREDAVLGYLENINKAFVNLSQLSSQMTDSVPRQIVEHVDRHKNPHTYTKQAITRATGENQYALGRVLGLESFRRQLHEAVSENFPEVPLPERRHQPIKPPQETNGGGEEGSDSAQNVPNGGGAGETGAPDGPAAVNGQHQP
ncbi:hypothetical protein B9479_004867 [Cryptococcus floricola]|uniref:Mediator of RNA polymerase II transcription subunit 10 n=1 Tax=Cryptococcus floricola TaxID=2591691 RepID=A0A5D3AW25_9TREE|nr:hypothetical protein B9479_004867 [Cryptococcus floricola]